MGDIDIIVNGTSFEYSIIKLPNAQKQFLVDKRFKIIVKKLPLSDTDITVECKIINFKGDNVKGYVESGEGLNLVSFYRKKLKLSIGIEDQINNVYCECIEYGLKITVFKQSFLKQLVFGIAWLSMHDEEKEEIYTWFAADPTLY